MAGVVECSAEAKAELVAFRRWRKANPRPKRPFRFQHWDERDWRRLIREDVSGIAVFGAEVPSGDRRCRRCGTLYPARLVGRAFRTVGDRQRVRDTSRTQRRIGVCRPCEQTARDTKKRDDRWLVKARDVIRRHAVRLRDRWPGLTVDELVRTYGWEPKRLAHDAEFQYDNGCSYCGQPYQDMGHGLSDITLDVQDPTGKPYYRTNTKWCCQTCNRKKGKSDPEAFEADRQIYELWTEQQARGYDPLTDDPGSLFHAAV